MIFIHTKLQNIQENYSNMYVQWLCVPEPYTKGSSNLSNVFCEIYGMIPLDRSISTECNKDIIAKLENIVWFWKRKIIALVWVFIVSKARWR